MGDTYKFFVEVLLPTPCRPEVHVEELLSISSHSHRSEIFKTAITEPLPGWFQSTRQKMSLQNISLLLPHSAAGLVYVFHLP